MNELYRCWQNLRMRPLRSLLSTLGICFGVMAVIAMQSIGEGAKRETLDQIRALGTQNILIRDLDGSDRESIGQRHNDTAGLSLADIELLQSALPTIQAIAPSVEIQATVNLYNPEQKPDVLALTPDAARVRGLSIAEGRFLCQEDIDRRSLVCVIGSDLEASIGSSIELDDNEFDVVGRLSENAKKALGRRDTRYSIFIPLGTQQLFTPKIGQDSESLSELVVQLQPGENVEVYAPAIEDLLTAAHGGTKDFQVIVPKELLRQASRTQQTFNLVLGGIAALSLLVGGIGIMNIMLASVSERTREIGIRRAIGATRKNIMAQFLMETCLLASIGGVLGVLGGAFIAVAVSLLAGWPTVVTVISILIALIMAIGVGLCSGLYPAYKASQLHPVEALRHT